MKEVLIAYCYASGLIEFGPDVPEGAIEIARGPQDDLVKAVSVVARHGYGASEGALLVPGVPEASNEDDAIDALIEWRRWCGQRAASGVVWNVGAQV